MDEFNETTPNNPDVRYFSWAGQLSSDQIKYMCVPSEVITLLRISPLT
jgi:hypothetical protein